MSTTNSTERNNRDSFIRIFDKACFKLNEIKCWVMVNGVHLYSKEIDTLFNNGFAIADSVCSEMTAEIKVDVYDNNKLKKLLLAVTALVDIKNRSNQIMKATISPYRFTFPFWRTQYENYCRWVDKKINGLLQDYDSIFGEEALKREGVLVHDHSRRN